MVYSMFGVLGVVEREGVVLRMDGCSRRRGEILGSKWLVGLRICIVLNSYQMLLLLLRFD
jgi:hypothetical protein